MLSGSCCVSVWLRVCPSYAHICCSPARCVPAEEGLASGADVTGYGARLPGDRAPLACVSPSCLCLGTRAQTEDCCWSLCSSVARLAETALFLGCLGHSWAQLEAAAVFITLF